VYAAAFNFYSKVEQNEISMRIAKQMLSAEYQATVLAAWEMSRKYPGRAGSRRLVLTALGGGVHGNPRPLIIEAVASSVDLIRKSGLDVYFVCFDAANYQESINAGLKTLVDSTGGRVITDKVQLDNPVSNEE
jgi:O-acetyl-ADP-ribose deacetylase (regulator of RNase III)